MRENATHGYVGTAIEEDIVEGRIGPVEPGEGRVWSVDTQFQEQLFEGSGSRSSCWLERDEIPVDWINEFPPGEEIIKKALELRPDDELSPDGRLMRRRDCEFEIFRSLEEAVELPAIKKGFLTVDDFIKRAQTVLQRRKSRSGRSLELHIRQVFREEMLVEDSDFSYQRESDPG